MGRRSRKARRATGTAARPAPAPRQRAAEPEVPPRPARTRGEARNEEIRASLEPLAPGERPTPVTVAAAVCAVGIVVLVVGYATGLISHEHAKPAGVISSVIILAIAGVGMWQARYWAVLGFQAILALNILVMFLLLLRAGNALAVLVSVVVLVPASWLFYKLVRAMARLQMPTRSAP